MILQCRSNGVREGFFLDYLPLDYLLIKQNGNEARPEELCGRIIQSADLRTVEADTEFWLVPLILNRGEGFKSRLNFDAKSCVRKLSCGEGPHGKPLDEERGFFLTGTI